jgi:hypothetical protein
MNDEKHDTINDASEPSPPTMPAPGHDDTSPTTAAEAARIDVVAKDEASNARRPRRRGVRWVAPVPPSPPLLLPIEEAAPRLGLTEDGLRARLRRIVERLPDGSVPILPGVAGVRLGKHWRIRFDVA